MTDAADPGLERRKVWVAWIAVAATVAAIGIYIVRSPQTEGTQRSIVRMGRALGRLIGKEDPDRKPIEVVIRELEQGDEVQRTQTIALLRIDLTDPSDFEKVFPYLIRALNDDSKSVREVAVSTLGMLVSRFQKVPGLEEPIASLLDHPSPTVRAAAAGYLLPLAVVRHPDAPPPRLVACLDDDSEEVRAAAAETLVEYGQGTALFLPVAFRRLPTESPKVFGAFTRILWNLRFPPSTLPLLIEGLSSDNALVCVSAATMINHMGLDAQSARPAVMALLRKELETPHSWLDLRLMDWGDGSRVPNSGVDLVVLGTDTKDVLHVRIFDTGGRRITDADETTFPARADAIAALKKQLETLRPPHTPSPAEKRRVIAEVATIIGKPQFAKSNMFSSVDIIEQTSEALVQLSPDGDPLPGTVEILCEVLKRPNVQQQHAAAWSLGFLGRTAAPAVPLLLSTFEATPREADDPREIIAQALAQITAGTPDEDRVIPVLANAWRTAPQRQKSALARALQTFGPKAEELVPELRDLPRNSSPSPISRGRSPRSFVTRGIGGSGN